MKITSTHVMIFFGCLFAVYGLIHLFASEKYIEDDFIQDAIKNGVNVEEIKYLIKVAKENGMNEKTCSSNNFYRLIRRMQLEADNSNRLDLDKYIQKYKRMCITENYIGNKEHFTQNQCLASMISQCVRECAERNPAQSLGAYNQAFEDCKKQTCQQQFNIRGYCQWLMNVPGFPDNVKGQPVPPEQQPFREFALKRSIERAHSAGIRPDAYNPNFL